VARHVPERLKRVSSRSCIDPSRGSTCRSHNIAYSSKRRAREVRLRVQPPPLLAELAQRLLAGIEQRQLPHSLAPPQLGVERLGVALAPEHLRPVLTRLRACDEDALRLNR
jgi:hypothetical protein